MHSISSIRRDQDVSPFAFSSPPHKSSDGTRFPAQITVQLFGNESPGPLQGDITVYMSFDEAAELGSELTALVDGANKGEFSQISIELTKSSGRSPLT